MTDAEAELIMVAHCWVCAMVGDDPDEIGAFMADEWTIIGSDGKVTDKREFLDLVRSGVVVHDVAESSEMSVRIYGDAAVMLARRVSGGTYRGEPFREVERVTCVFVRRDGRWQCVLTQLAPFGS